MVTVYFATNRNLEGTKSRPKFGTTFNVHGPHAVRFGRAEVEGKRVKIEVADEVITTRDEAETILGSNEVFHQVMRKMAKHSRDTLVYVHGFGFSFSDAVQLGAGLKKTYSGRGPINVFVFSWPGDGRMVPFMSYYSDRSVPEIRAWRWRGHFFF